MAKKTLPEKLHNMLIEFIGKKRRGFDEVAIENLVKKMELEIPVFLSRHFNFAKESLYDELDHGYFDDILKELARNPQAFEENEWNDSFFSEYIRLYDEAVS